MAALQMTALNVLGFLQGVLRSSLWGGMKHLPYAVLSSLALSLSAGLVIWVWVTPHSGLVAEQRTWLEPLFLAMYAAIGMLWAAQRVLDRVAIEALETIDRQAVTLLDPLFEAIAEHDPLDGREPSVAELRQRWFDAKKQMVAAAAPVGRFSLFGRMAQRIARFWIDRQTAVVRQVLDDLSARGETDIDVACLGRLFQRRAVRQLVAAGEHQLAVVRCWCYLPLLAAALLPPALCWLATQATS